MTARQWVEHSDLLLAFGTVEPLPTWEKIKPSEYIFSAKFTKANKNINITIYYYIIQITSYDDTTVSRTVVELPLYNNWSKALPFC